MTHRSRIAAIVDDVRLPLWQASAVESLSEFGEVEVIVLQGQELPDPRRPFLFDVYQRIDAWVSPHSPGPHETTRASLPHKTIRRDELDECLPDATSSIDLVVDFTRLRVSDCLPTSTQMIVTPGAGLDRAALFAALLGRQTVVSAAVRVRSLDGTGIVAESNLAVFRLSLRRTYERVGWRFEQLLRRAVIRLLDEESPPRLVDPRESGRALTIRNGPIARLVLSAGVAAVRASITRVDWRVAWGERGDDDPFVVPSRLQTLDAPAGHFFADPFLARDEARTVVFFEDFDSELGRASIAVAELGDEARGHRTVLQRDHHLSYPFIFMHESTWYMVPEMAETKRVVLFRCVDFPDQWVEDSVLLEGVAAFDPTLLQFDDLWWLFYSSGTAGSSSDDELHVDFSPSLRGPFRSHPLNPVRSDAVGARPAGRILVHDGRLLRPGQDSAREYGGGIVIHQIETLTTERYEERAIGRIDRVAGRRNRGVHTIDSTAEVVVVDTKHRVLKRPRSRIGSVLRAARRR